MAGGVYRGQVKPTLGPHKLLAHRQRTSAKLTEKWVGRMRRHW